MTVLHLRRWAAGLARTVAVLVAVCALILAVEWIWTELSPPRIVFGDVFWPFPKERSSLGSLFIQNRGRATARDVLVKVSDLGSEIVRLEIQYDGGWMMRDGGVGADGFALLLYRLWGGSTARVDLSAREAFSLSDRLSVTYEGGEGIPAALDAELQPLRIRDVLCPSCVFFLLVGLLTCVATRWFLRERFANTSEVARQLLNRAQADPTDSAQQAV
jgi:hypothetical protein